MAPKIAGCGPLDPIPGMGVHRYLCEAAKFFDIERFMRLGWKVQSARLKDDDTLDIIYSSSKNPSVEGTIQAQRLVVATGLASEPYMPHLPGQEHFQGVFMHSKELKSKSEELSLAKNVLVLGGNKSAYDACYQVAQHGGVAHMIIRPSGGGPSFQWPSSMRIFGRMTALPVLASTRFFTLFDPWPFVTEYCSIRSFLHRWTIGQKITQTFWSWITDAYVRRLKDDKRTALLIPWTSAYWMGTSLGTLNYPTDWHQQVREGRVVVHHAEVVSLSPTDVELTDGLIKHVNAIVCCTGWRSISPIQFQPATLELGLTSLPKEAGDEETLARDARAYILQQRPFLASPPRTMLSSNITTGPDSTPCRLYRYMIPPTKHFITSRNLAFFAADNPLAFTTAADIQTLWITAFFSNKLSHLQQLRLDVDRVHRDTMLLTEYERLRRPKIAGGVGERYGEFVFDRLPYLDLLVRDLGLEWRRKDTLWKEWFKPYGVAEYKGLVEEWMLSKGGMQRNMP